MWVWVQRGCAPLRHTLSSISSSLTGSPALPRQYMFNERLLSAAAAPPLPDDSLDLRLVVSEAEEGEKGDGVQEVAPAQQEV